MARVIYAQAKDKRLQGLLPPARFQWFVDGDVPMTNFSHSFAVRMDAQAREDPDLTVNLTIYGHGAPGHVQFCKEDLTVNTLWGIRPIRGRINRIDFISCKVALYDDGTKFCSELAKYLNCYVRASDSREEGDFVGEDGFFRLHAWKGTLTTWGPSGVVAKKETIHVVPRIKGS